MNRSNKTRSLLLDKYDRCHSDRHYRVDKSTPRDGRLYWYCVQQTECHGRYLRACDLPSDADDLALKRAIVTPTIFTLIHPPPSHSPSTPLSYLLLHPSLLPPSPSFPSIFPPLSSPFAIVLPTTPLLPLSLHLPFTPISSRHDFFRQNNIMLLYSLPLSLHPSSYLFPPTTPLLPLSHQPPFLPPFSLHTPLLPPSPLLSPHPSPPTIFPPPPLLPQSSLHSLSSRHLPSTLLLLPQSSLHPSLFLPSSLHPLPGRRVVGPHYLNNHFITNQW